MIIKFQTHQICLLFAFTFKIKYLYLSHLVLLLLWGQFVMLPSLKEATTMLFCSASSRIKSQESENLGNQSCLLCFTFLRIFVIFYLFPESVGVL